MKQLGGTPNYVGPFIQKKLLDFHNKYTFSRDNSKIDNNKQKNTGFYKNKINILNW